MGLLTVFILIFSGLFYAYHTAVTVHKWHHTLCWSPHIIPENPLRKEPDSLVINPALCGTKLCPWSLLNNTANTWAISASMGCESLVLIFETHPSPLNLSEFRGKQCTAVYNLLLELLHFPLLETNSRRLLTKDCSLNFNKPRRNPQLFLELWATSNIIIISTHVIHAHFLDDRQWMYSVWK